MSTAMQHFRPIGPNPKDKGAQAIVLQADIEMNAIDPDVREGIFAQITLVKLVVL